ncbi:hypothetical protein KFK09_027663 [Dendrobium nobile]|uniref:Uncharacterized protein n=1 Tax=Dendrobium nobile TaxID=94219 RepID=A0A8T3A1C2_DENNO|nr:hypothetical protein KFK09_027663 [Dendrobium nobile]
MNEREQNQERFGMGGRLLTRTPGRVRFCAYPESARGSFSNERKSRPFISVAEREILPMGRSWG